MQTEIELALADLIADANGEIVLFNDSGVRSLAIRTDQAVVADAVTDTAPGFRAQLARGQLHGMDQAALLVVGEDVERGTHVRWPRAG